MATDKEADEQATKPKDRVEFLAQCRARFKRCVDATAANRVFQLDDVKFAAGSPDNGWQWPQDLLNSRMKPQDGGSPRPTITVNKLPQHIKLVTNEQRKNKPQGRILPVDDQGDIEVAEVLNGTVRHIEVSSHADVAYDTACECQVTSGEGYWRILTEYTDEKSFEQDIRIAGIKNPFSVYLDPDGLRKDSTGRRCEFGFITDRLSTADYKRAFPNAKSKADWDDLALGDDTFTWFDDNGVMIAEYFYVEYEKTKLVLWSDGSVTVGDEMPQVAGLQPVDQRETQLRSVKWCKVNGIEVLEENDWAGKYIPIVRVVGNEWDVEGQIVVAGIVRNAKDAQRMVNYWTSQEAEMLALMPKAPFVGTPEQFEGHEDKWRDANITPFAYLPYNNVASSSGAPLPPPQRVAPPMPPVGIIEAKRGSADDLQATVGQYNPSLGAEAKEKSGRAIQARQQQADIGTFHYIDNLSRSIGYSTEIILDLIPKIYDTERVARIIGEDGEPDQCAMCVGQGVAVRETTDEDGAIKKIYDPSIGKYDVVVSVGPSFTTKRLEAAEYLTAQSQAAKDPVTNQVLTYLSLKSQDWHGANEAADMIKRLIPPEIAQGEDADPKDPEVMMAQVKQAAQQLGQKEAQLNQAHEQIAVEAEEAEQKRVEAEQAELKAKDAMQRVEAEVNKLNAQQQALDNERELFALTKQLAEKEDEIARTNAQAEKSVLEADCKTIQANMDKKLAEINTANESVEKENKSQEATQKLIESLMEKIEKVEELASAERELVLDEQGEPVGSRPVVRKAA